MDSEQSNLALSPYRALDLTDEKGLLCGKILADLGADVIKIEKPGGEPARNIGPFYKDVPDPEKSFYWFAYNANKRGITLNIETMDGREIFKKLVKSADFVLESFPPRYMDSIGLGYSALSEINPGVIMTSITHFGQAGPYKGYKGSDIVDMAMSGFMYLAGDIDRPPVRISFPQAYLSGGLEAAVGTMIAFHHCRLTGEGQWVDVSIRDSIIRSLYNVRVFWDLNQHVVRRAGPLRSGLSTGASPRDIWPCKDGAVNYQVMGGIGGLMTNRAMTKWVEEEGLADDFLKTFDWEKFDMATASRDTHSKIEENITRLFMKHTKDELWEGAKKRRIMLYPVSDMKGIVENEQLAARGFWEEVEYPEMGAKITHPGAFVKCSKTPLRIRRRAPRIGEHNEEVYKEIGVTKEDLVMLRQANII